jgi:hypothetical protein
MGNVVYIYNYSEKRVLILTGVDPSFPKHKPSSTPKCVRHRSQGIQRGDLLLVWSKSQRPITLD